MSRCPEGCRPEVLEELRRRASRPYAVRNPKPDTVRAEIRGRMADCMRAGRSVYRSGDVIPITVHPRFRFR